MAVLEARIFASVYGTAAELGASPAILGIGERWYRTDAPLVTDITSPYYQQRDPSKQWKTGDGTKTRTQITQYDPIGLGTSTGGGSAPELNPASILANTSDETSVGTSLLIAPDAGNPDAPSLQDFLDVASSGDLSNIVSMIGTVSEAEASAGGLRNILNTFMNIAVVPTVAVTGSITNGSDVVQLTAPLNVNIGPWSRVFITGGGTGVAQPAYINSIATDRMSFRLTSTMFNFVTGNGTVMNATATGSRTFNISEAGTAIHGIQLAGLIRQNVYNGLYEWRSTPNTLQNDTITGETVQSRIRDGILHWRSAQVNGGAWEQVTGAVDLVLQMKTVVAQVGPTSHHTWTNLAATPVEFMNEDATTKFRHRFNLLIPDDNFTQFMFGTDTLFTGGTNTSTMWVEFLDPADLVWKDLTTSRVTVSLNTPIDTVKISAFGTLTAAAKAAAAARVDRGIYCRIMGQTTGAATGSPQFSSVWTVIK